ncbi:DUF257 family protein [Thermococcus barossii]|uniref:DUF257 family protein n=1 Tax=Thermococcus barossii TaxID=54077 RepID=UPI00300287AC
MLVEYSAVSSPELLLYLMCRRCENVESPVLIDDISDTFSEYVIRLELMGLDTEPLMEIPVIKIGGNREFGNVVGRVEVDKYSLDFKYYGKIYDKVVPEKVVCNPVLGIHKLFVALERQEVIRLVRNISTFVGRKSRFAFYFINRDVMERKNPELLPLLEETASTVLQWEAGKGKYRLRALKAANDEILGSVVSMSFKDILGA